MKFDFDIRPSDSSFVESVWQTQTAGGGSFISIAASHWEMVFTKQKGKFTLSIRGPETKASPAPIPTGHVEYFGIIFKCDVFMHYLHKKTLVNDAVHLPETIKNSFWLQGETWEFPNFENADTFVSRLTRNEMLLQDNVVKDVLLGRTRELSLRSVQRRFLHVTGLAYKTIQQIERARQALIMLQSGTPILETATQAGYFDQSHLTRSLKLFSGQTPIDIVKSSHVK